MKRIYEWEYKQKGQMRKNESGKKEEIEKKNVQKNITFMKKMNKKNINKYR